MEFRDNPILLERFRRGDRETLTMVYETYVQKVVTMLTGGFTFSSQGEVVRFSGYRSPHEVQDAIQEIFLKAFGASARNGYDGHRDYQPYLLQIARNVVIDGFRRQKSERAFVTMAKLVHEGETDDEAIGRLSNEHENPEDVSARNQVFAAVRAFVNTLGPEDQRLVSEHLAGELSQAQMAQELGVDRNEIRRRIKNIRESLLHFMKSNRLIDDVDAKQLLEVLLIVGGLQ